MPSYNLNNIECSDVASLEVYDSESGDYTHYRCYVWVATPERTFGIADGHEQTVESEICVVDEAGEEVTIFRGRVRAPATTGHVCDSPKVVGVVDFDGTTVRTLFIVHWLEGARNGSPDLHRSYLNPEDAAWTWTHTGTLTSSNYWQFDVCPIPGGLAGYVIVHRATTLRFDTYRYLTATTAFLGGAVWATAHTIDAEPAGLLCVYAHAATGWIVYAWERELAGANPGEIWCHRMDTVNGSSVSSWRAMSGIEPSAWMCGGFEEQDSDRYALVVEGKPMVDSDGYGVISASLSFVSWQLQDPSSAAEASGTGRCFHLRLLSRPWGRADGRTAGPERLIRAIVAYSEIGDAEYQQSAAFVADFPICNVDLDQRALPAGNLNLRLVDARASGAHPNSAAPGDTSSRGPLTNRRTNHVSSLGRPSNVKFGSGYTSEGRAFRAAICVYTKIVSVPNPFVGSQPDMPTIIIPAQTSVVGVSVHSEEPWVVQRDDYDTEGNAANFRGVYAWHPYQPIPIADMLAIAGGVPQIYDGRRAVEIGWTWYPEIIQLLANAGGSFAAGDYYYTAVYEWEDAAGHIHRSAPARPARITVAANDLVDINIACNTFSRRFDADAEVKHAKIVVYRADPGTTVFRQVFGEINNLSSAQFIDTPWNLPDYPAIDLVDGGIDVSSHQPLPWTFTDGAWTPLVPQMPPAASIGCMWRNRLLLVPSEEPHAIWYSLEVQPGPGSSVIAAPEFSPTNVYRLDAEQLLITALVPMDDHVIVFGADAIYTLTGSFNNDLGYGASLELTAVHRGVGCIDQRTVVRTSDGVFFQSARGIEFMDKGWSLSNLTIGSSVEDDVAVSGNLRAATWIEAKRQVLWLGNAAEDGEPIALVYHYAEKDERGVGVWTRFTLPEGDQTTAGDGDSWMSSGADACVWRAGGEQLHVVLQQGALIIERDSGDADLHVDQVRTGTAGNSADTNAYNGFDIELGWLSLAGLLGCKRVWKVLAIHDPIVADSPGIRLDVDSDVHSGEYPETGVSTQTLTRSAPAVGVSDFRLGVQKLSGMRLRLRRTGSFTDLPTWSVLGFSLEIGVKPGLRKTASSQRGT